MNHNQAADAKSPMRYVLCELSPGERDEFEEHLADCSDCMNEVWLATTFAANTREVFRTRPASSARTLRAAWRDRFPRPALAFSFAMNIAFAAVMGYGTLRVYPALRADLAEFSAPAAIEVVPVRAVERDATASPQVVKASGKLVVLTFDLPRPYERFVYSIENPAGAGLMSGELPGGSESLNLRVPISRLAPGSYKVKVAGISGNQRDDLGTCILQVTR